MGVLVVRVIAVIFFIIATIYFFVGNEGGFFGFGSACGYTWLYSVSISDKRIKAANDMLEALQNLENDDNSIPEHAWKLVKDAIAKATEVY